MNHHTNTAGQRIDYRSNNDNSPARYSAPITKFKEILVRYAKPRCSRCGGTGYIGDFKHVCAGRCFKCISETDWMHAQEELNQSCESRTGCDEMAEIFLEVCGKDESDPAYLSDGIWITPDGHTYDAANAKGPSSEEIRSAFRSANAIA